MSILAPPTQQAYDEFLATKRIAAAPVGFDVAPEALNGALRSFQPVVLRWALRRGRAAIFAGTGLGKTPIQLDWAQQVQRHSSGNVLILAPLAVAQQTVREGQKFGIPAKVVTSQDEVEPGLISVSNYEKLHKFDPSAFTGVVLDESSILKSFDGATCRALIEAFAATPYRLCCTATPAPNDHTEIGTHAEFLGIMRRVEMLATFFTHDGGDTSKWVLRGWGGDEFYKWLASWAVMLRKPSDLAFSDEGFELPPLQMEQITVPCSEPTQGYLVPVEARTLNEQRRARRDSLTDRVGKCIELVAQHSADQWLIWCDLNDEQHALAKALGNACVSIEGTTPEADRLRFEEQWRTGAKRILITKPTVFGWGMNWQHCHKAAFVGVSHSWEQFYQAVRRIWRTGQEYACEVYVITSELEGAVVRNLQRKEEEAMKMQDGMIAEMGDLSRADLAAPAARETDEYRTATTTGHGWTMHLGDCVEVLTKLESESIGYAITSPPFGHSLYAYSNSPRDIGNGRSYLEFARHMRFVIRELYRVLMPGRLVSLHCMTLPKMKERDGVIGLFDFRGSLTRLMEREGFIFHSETMIRKDPVQAVQRTKALGLLHKQIVKDSAMSRQALPDWLITFRKPGVNPRPIAGAFDIYYGERQPPTVPYTSDDDSRNPFSIEVWQRYAESVWDDISPSDVLSYTEVRDERDQKHICPLQLTVIRRGLQMWTVRGDTVLDPFTGIGSTGCVALELGRRFCGAELKPSYYQQAVRNLQNAEMQAAAPTLFDLLEEAA